MTSIFHFTKDINHGIAHRQTQSCTTWWLLKCLPNQQTVVLWLLLCSNITITVSCQCARKAPFDSWGLWIFFRVGGFYQFQVAFKLDFLIAFGLIQCKMSLNRKYILFSLHPVFLCCCLFSHLCVCFCLFITSFTCSYTHSFIYIFLRSIC